MARFEILAAVVVGALALSACGSKETATATETAAPRTAAADTRVDESTAAYFQVSVGDTVVFATDRSDLSSQARAVLDRQARWLQLNPEKAVTIEGHADERGTREYNLALGARRANAVRAYLNSKGVTMDRLRAVSYGKERPVEVCSNESCWSKNRRSVTVVDG